MATDAIVSFAIERLGDLVIQEAKFLYGVSDRVKRLQEELQRMRSFLKDADMRQHESVRVRNWIMQIREAAYDAEDVLENFVLKVTSKRKGGLQNACKKFSCILSNPVTLHKIGSEIEDITTRLSEMATAMQNYGIQEALNEESSSPWRGKQREERESFPDVLDQNLEGLEPVVQDMVTVLVDEKKHFRVVSICGMGGLGKTTLAKQIYHHPNVKKHFDHFAWVYISRECQRRETWEGILIRLCPGSSSDRIIGLRDQELIAELVQFMKNNKCLVVLDDIWSPEAWDRLKDAFPHETPSKIILTSRNKDIAFHADPEGLLHEPQCLTEEESWNLFQKIAFPRRNDTGSEDRHRLEELGKQMVKHCAGLPLAINVLGGLLAKKLTFGQWKKVQENIKTYITKGIGQDKNDTKVYNVLSLSYDDLSSQLKKCFLYLAQFPEDYEIPVDKLLKFWAAEGLVSSACNEAGKVEEVAECLFDELVERSMVLVGSRDITNSRILTCQMHDLMRDICLLKAEEESFARVINPASYDASNEVFSPGNFRRLAVHLFQMKDNRFFKQKSIGGQKLRSLLYFNRIVNYITGDNRTWKLLEPGFKDLCFLRVLDLEGADVKDGKLPQNIGELIHLRFLSLKDGNVSVFPSSLGELTLLETLDLRVYNAYVPDVLWKMQRLRHLYLPVRCDKKTKLRLGNMKNLQTLENFQLGVCDVRDLFTLTSLKSLTAYRSWIARGFEEIIPESLSIALKHLEYLSLGGSPDFGVTEDNLQPAPPAVDIRPVISSYANLSALVLYLKIVDFPTTSQFPRDIASITLGTCNLEKDPMPVLEKLPNLRSLDMRWDAYVGKTMVCSKNGFPRLHSLHMFVLDSLEEWHLEEGAMPNLSTLSIGACEGLKVIPKALKGLQNLKEIEFYGMPRAFKDKLVPGGEEFYKVQHVPSVVFEHCDRE